MAKEIMIERGCLSSRLYHDENEEAVFVCEQVWRNQDDLEQHLRSKDYGHMILLMELADEPPEIKFQTISETAGIEVIEKARGITRDGDV
jgi:quinol monooxygenase YgiN